MSEQTTHRHEYACDRCDATKWAYPEEAMLLGLGCDCGGAWIDVTASRGLECGDDA